MMASPPDDPASANRGAVAPGAKPLAPRTSSKNLLREGGELVIEHAGREYPPRITQNAKLVLTA